MSLVERAKGIQRACRRHGRTVNLYLVTGGAVPKIWAFPQHSEMDRVARQNPDAQLVAELPPDATVPQIHQAMTRALDEWAEAS